MSHIVHVAETCFFTYIALCISGTWMRSNPGDYISTDADKYARNTEMDLHSSNFSFKCHRKDQAPNVKDQTLVYSVNDITFHPVHGTFSTAGADGTVNFWDKDARTRLKSA